MGAPNVYYTIATNKLDTQMQSIDQLDAKVATVFTFASVILAFSAGLISLAVFPANHGLRIVALVFLGVYHLYLCLPRLLHLSGISSRRLGIWTPCRRSEGTFSDNMMRRQCRSWSPMHVAISHEENTALIDQKIHWFTQRLI